ncbi:MAG: hypothetical protein M1826_006070 [Phylliscum demangeonii]|nr:MAG: hypothetical protein M1826_006070 [Phylliscum demangeonii]
MRKAFDKFGWDVPEPLLLHTDAFFGPNDAPSPAIDPAESVEPIAPTTPPLANKAVAKVVNVKQTSSDASRAATQFLIPATIGGQALALNVDTGSSDLWVFSSKLPGSESKGHAVFDPAKSATFQPVPGASFAIKYGDQSHAEGVVGKDSVNIGGAVVVNHPIELASSVSGSFAFDTNADGIIGLGFGVSNQVKPNRQPTFFENVMSSLDQPVFTASLKRGAPGSYGFGTINPSLFQGSLNYAPVDPSQGWWMFNSSGAVIGDQKISTTGTPSIADTGTSILLMVDAVVDAYYAQVPGAVRDPLHNGFVYPCDAALPDLGIAITDAYTAIIPGRLMTFSQTDLNTCFGALQSNRGQSVQILGDTLFNTQFVVFDGGKTRVGFAPHA